MDEREARDWLESNVPRETVETLLAFAALLVGETRQNLIGPSTRVSVLGRHIVDSAQLVGLGDRSGPWLDLGSGAGLPGIVTAIITGQPTVLVESRPLRSNWLRRVIDTLALGNVTVHAERLERVATFSAAVITARAFAPLPRLFDLAARFAGPETLWILPKGRHAAEELASVGATWHGDFTMQPSITDPDSAIIVGRGVRPRRTRRGGARA